MGNTILFYLSLVIHSSYCLPPKITYQMKEAEQRYKEAKDLLNQIVINEIFEYNSLEYIRALHQVALYESIIQRLWKKSYSLHHQHTLF